MTVKFIGVGAGQVGVSPLPKHGQAVRLIRCASVGGLAWLVIDSIASTARGRAGTAWRHGGTRA